MPQWICYVAGSSEICRQRISRERSRTASPGAMQQINTISRWNGWLIEVIIYNSTSFQYTWLLISKLFWDTLNAGHLLSKHLYIQYSNYKRVNLHAFTIKHECFICVSTRSSIYVFSWGILFSGVVVLHTYFNKTQTMFNAVPGNRGWPLSECLLLK